MIRALLCLTITIATAHCPADTINLYRVTVPQERAGSFESEMAKHRNLATVLQAMGSNAVIHAKATLKRQGNFYYYNDTRPLTYPEQFHPKTGEPLNWTQRDVGLRVNGYMKNGSLELNYHESLLEQWVIYAPGLPYQQPVFSTQEINTSVHLGENEVITLGGLSSNGQTTVFVFERLLGDHTPPDNFSVLQPANYDQFRVLVYEKEVITANPTDPNAQFEIVAAKNIRETGKLVELYELTTTNGRLYWFDDRREIIGGDPQSEISSMKSWTVGTTIFLLFDKDSLSAQENTSVHVNFQSRTPQSWLKETYTLTSQGDVIKMGNKISATTPFPIVGGTSFQSDIQLGPDQVVELSGSTESTRVDDGPIKQVTRSYFLERIAPRIPQKSKSSKAPFGHE